MTKEITKAYILQQIQDKFKLREFEPEIFRFSEMVIPTYDIDSHLGTWEVKVETKTITSIGSKVVATVPQNERWTLRSYQTTFMTGAYTIAGIMIGRPLTAKYIYLDLKAAQSVSYLVNLPIYAVLQPGEALLANVDGYTSTGDLRVNLDVLVEEIR